MTGVQKRLRSDEGGAVLVLGIMLGVFSVAALAYLVNVGYASIWREAAQDAADAVAFESAVWSARGMNVIAAINIFIALTMAVLIAWRLALMAVGLLTIVSAVLCFIPATFAVCAQIVPRLAQVSTRMATRDPQVTRNVYKVINVLHTGQTVVASAMPILAAARSSVTGLERPRVRVAAALGTHLLPATVIEKIVNGTGSVAGTGFALKAASKGPGVDTKKPGPGGKQPGSGVDLSKPSGPANGKKPPQQAGCPVPGAKPPQQPGSKPKGKRRVRLPGQLLGVPFSLPAEKSDDLEVLCPRGSQMLGGGMDLVVSTLLRELLGVDTGGSSSEPPGRGAIGTALEYLTGALPTASLCGDFGSAGSDFIQKQVDQACADNLTQQQTKFEKEKKSGESWQDACKRTTKADLEAKQKDVATSQKNTSARGGTQEPAFAEVWGPMANGNIFTQNWALAEIERDSGAIERLVGLAGSFGGGGTTTATAEANEESALLFAQSEVFFDCEGDWDGACYPDAAWTLNWRARMRRLHSPFEIAAEGIEQRAMTEFSTILQQDPIQKVLGALPLGPLTDVFAPVAGGLVPESLKLQTEQLRSQVAERGGAAARWVVEQGVDRASFIH